MFLGVRLYHGDRVQQDGSLIETVSAFKRTGAGWKLYAISDLVNPADAPVTT